MNVQSFLQPLGVLFLFFLVGSVPASVLAQTGGSTKYVYDDNGRLRAVISPSGEAAQYNYDAAGNLTGITRQASTQTAILDFSPRSGVVGTTVTICGTGFSATANQNVVKFNGVAAPIESASTTQLTVTVPVNAQTGLISITAPNGTATSASAVNGGTFTVIATTYTPSDIEYSNSMTLNSSLTVTINTPNKVGTVTFSGSAGQRIFLKISQSTFPDNNFSFGAVIRILKPDGMVLASQNTNTLLITFIDTQTLPVTGTYTILVDPVETKTGSVLLTLTSVPLDLAGTITPGGSAVSLTTTAPGQNASYTFTGTVGQRVLLKISGATFPGPFCGSEVALTKPDGTYLGSDYACDLSTTYIDTKTLPVSGTYTITVNPYEDRVGSVTLTLFNVPNDVTGTIAMNGVAVTAANASPGRNVQLTFSGTANQRISTLISNSTFAGCSSTVTILNPNGTMLGSVFGCAAGNTFIDTQTLPVTGTYTILVDPAHELVGSLQVTLYNVPADVSGAIIIGSPATTVSFTTPGQNGKITFSGTAGQVITVQVTNSTFTNFASVLNVSLLKPDGMTLTSTSSVNASFNLAQQTLPVTGIYTISFDPSGAATGSLSVNITSP